MSDEAISYHAVNKDGMVTAIWEMQGRKHLRTIDPRSSEGKRILSTYTEGEDTSNAIVGDQNPSIPQPADAGGAQS